MAVTRLEIRTRGLYEDGTAFGDAGAYERIDGSLHFAVDPEHRRNGDIVDLDKAERDAAGMVRFAADFCLLQPIDAGRANRRLLLDVVNRGRKLVPRMINRAPVEPIPTERIPAGDAFLLRRGWTLAWCGWQWDVHRGAGLMGVEVPQALEAGRPIAGQVLVQFQPNAMESDHLLADRQHRAYPAADEDDPTAVLTVRDSLDGPRTVIQRERWQFAGDDDGRARPDRSRIRLDDGFEPGRIYEAVYRTDSCPVAGAGLLALRDAAAFLRYGRFGDEEAGNPCAGRIDYAFACGASQTGRLLREFLYLGLNLDEQGRQVFDGLLPTIAGAHRGEFNHRYAQPSVQASRGFGQLPPFTDDEQTDPFTGSSDGLLARQRALGGVPKIIYTNTAAEYWPGDVSRGDASLTHTVHTGHTDPVGVRDLEPPDEVRIYYYAGTQHTAGALPPASLNPLDGTRGAHSFNVTDYSLLNRAALVNLERWVTAGEQPPASLFPRLDDGTAATIAQVLETIGSIPGAVLPDPALLASSRRIDLGPDAGRGIGRFPALLGEPYTTYVSAVDADGNETAGIRLPSVLLPVATYTGWNPRHPSTGGAGQIVMMLGSTLPFPATAADRESTGDPRRSIAERYGDGEEYLARARAAARALAAQGYLLPDDVETAARQALERYEAFAAPAGQRAGAEAGNARAVSEATAMV